MRPIGFSTGALARDNFSRAIQKLRMTPARAIEISALRENELPVLINELPNLVLKRYQYISVHAPSRFVDNTEESLAKKLMVFVERQWPIIVHGDLINNFDCWRPLGRYLCIENNDDRKATGRTAEEIASLFNKLPEATWCFDVAHARQIDPTMSQANLMLKLFSRRLRQVHLSELNSLGVHGPLTFATRLCCRKIAHLVPLNIPIIMESIMPLGVSPEEIVLEMKRARLALEPSVNRPHLFTINAKGIIVRSAEKKRKLLVH